MTRTIRTKRMTPKGCSPPLWITVFLRTFGLLWALSGLLMLTPVLEGGLLLRLVLAGVFLFGATESELSARSRIEVREDDVVVRNGFHTEQIPRSEVGRFVFTDRGLGRCEGSLQTTSGQLIRCSILRPVARACRDVAWAVDELNGLVASQ